MTIRATIVDIIDLRLSTFEHVISLCFKMIICESLHANDTARMTARESLRLVRIKLKTESACLSERVRKTMTQSHIQVQFCGPLMGTGAAFCFQGLAGAWLLASAVG